MSGKVIVFKKRYNPLQVNLGIDVSADTFVAQIREEPDQSSPLIAQWGVGFVTDGTDGKLRLTLDPSSSDVEQTSGYMDIKRNPGGFVTAAVQCWEEVVEVEFRGTVSA